MTTLETVATWLAAFGSRFPHITFSLTSLPTPTVFDLNKTPYVESLMFLGILPLMYLLLIMIILMVYYCCVGFSLKVKHDEKQRCCSASVGFYITSAILIMLTSLCALYGAVMLCAPAQEEIQKSIENLNPDQLVRDSRSVPQLLRNVTTIMTKIENNVLDELAGSSDAATFQEQVDEFRQMKNDDPLPSINNTSQMAKMNGYISTVEIYRYWWSIGLFALFALIAILSQFGVCFKSKGMLIGMTCISFFTLVLCDLSLSVQLSVGVALSDYCEQPDQAQENFIQMPDCESSTELQKVKRFINVAESIDEIMTSLINTKTGVENKDWTNFRNSIEQLIGIANSYQLLLDCTYVTAEYEKITESLCSGYIVGWWSVLGSSLLISIFFTQMLLFAPCVWRRFDPETIDNYPYKDDEDIPFVRPATFQQPTYPQTRQSVTLNYLCQSHDDLNFSDNRPPPYSSFS